MWCEAHYYYVLLQRRRSFEIDTEGTVKKQFERKLERDSLRQYPGVITLCVHGFDDVYVLHSP